MSAMDAEELREALADDWGTLGRLHDHWAMVQPSSVDAVLDAAFTIALPILEANEELVERIAEILQRSGCFEPSEAARAVLDALVHVDAK